MYIGLNTIYGTNKNPNRALDFLTKVLPKAVSVLARQALARRSGNETIGFLVRACWVKKNGMEAFTVTWRGLKERGHSPYLLSYCFLHSNSNLELISKWGIFTVFQVMIFESWSRQFFSVSQTSFTDKQERFHHCSIPPFRTHLFDANVTATQEL